MKVDELEKAINLYLTLSGWQIAALCGVLIVSFLVSYSLARAKKSGELAEIDSNYKKILDQQEKLTTLTESIKHDLNIESISYQIKLNKYHERRVEVIGELYRLLVEAHQAAKLWLQLASPSREEPGSEFKAASDWMERFIDYSRVNKIWVDEIAYKPVEDLALKLDRLIFNGCFTVGKDPNWNTTEFREALKRFNNNFDEVNNGLNNTMSELVDLLRSELEPKSKSNNRQN